MDNNIIQLNQAFFGNAQSGYRLLASTDNRFSTDAAFFCNAIGTPDGFSEIEPFLFSVPKDNSLLMFCCQSGMPDASGRKTLFFHAIIADRKMADDFNVNAYTLYEAGYFSKSLIANCRPIELAKPLKQSNGASGSFGWNGESLAIVSGKPETTLIKGLLGNSINSISWSSFAYQPLDNFRLYVISKYVNRPRDRKCILPSGEILPNSSREASPPKANQSSTIPQSSRGGNSRISKMLLVLSVLVNLVLAYILLTTPQTRVVTKEVIKEVPVEKIVYRGREVTKDAQGKAEPSVPSLTREQVLMELRADFPADKQITNFDDIVRNSTKLKTLKNTPNSEEIGLFDKITVYISFVNKHILNNQTDRDLK